MSAEWWTADVVKPLRPRRRKPREKISLWSVACFRSFVTRTKQPDNARWPLLLAERRYLVIFGGSDCSLWQRNFLALCRVVIRSVWVSRESQDSDDQSIVVRTDGLSSLNKPLGKCFVIPRPFHNQMYECVRQFFSPKKYSNCKPGGRWRLLWRVTDIFYGLWPPM